MVVYVGGAVLVSVWQWQWLCLGVCVCQLQALDAVIRILTTETNQRFIFDISALVKQ